MSEREARAKGTRGPSKEERELYEQKGTSEVQAKRRELSEQKNELSG
ncbi:hypothetical protein ACFC0X_25420 [Paenibacillus chitinolyticus]